MNRASHRVSVKIALINQDSNKVLMTRLHDGGYGLPGGHVEKGETPEQALDRELKEELGLTYEGPLAKVDFWRDLRTDRILLGFTGVLDEATSLRIDEREMVGVYWASLADFNQGKVATVTYESFIRGVLAKSI